MSAETTLEVGQKAPAFALKDQHGVTHKLSQYKGSPLVVYFYPKDDTTACTKEACAFRDALSDFGALGVAVVGISPDDVESHARFASKQKLSFPILSDTPDENGTPPVCAAYGTWQEKSMYGRKYMGVVRTTFLIDGTGKIIHKWDKVSVAGHVEEVLGVLRAEPAPRASPRATTKGDRPQGRGARR